MQDTSFPQDRGMILRKAESEICETGGCQFCFGIRHLQVGFGTSFHTCNITLLIRWASRPTSLPGSGRSKIYFYLTYNDFRYSTTSLFS